jgi:hypothetical protein
MNDEHVHERIRFSTSVVASLSLTAIMIRLSSESPFSHVLGTNYAPTDPELSQIRDLCAEPIEQIHKLDKEIDQLTAKLDELASRREQLQEYVDGHQALLSPIRRLCPELLQLIFTFCLPSSTNTPMLNSSAPLLLGRVCSAWRQLAHQTARLWSYIHIVLPPAQEALVELRHDAVVEWLERAKDVPLSISVNGEYVYSTLAADDSGELITGFFKLILPFIGRIKTFYLYLPNPIGTAGVVDLSQIDGPLLERLEVLMPVDSVLLPNPLSAPADIPEIIPFFLKAPRLRKLSYFGHGTDQLFNLVSFRGLTELNLSLSRILSIPQFLLIIEQCSNLQYLHLSQVVALGIGGHVPHANSDLTTMPIQECGQIILPSLTRVFLSAFGYDAPPPTEHVTMVLNHLTLPSLEALIVQLRESTVYNYYPTLTNHLKRSVCPLRKLRVRYQSAMKADLQSMSNYLWDLTHLDVVFAHETGTLHDAAFRDLMQMLSRTSILPNLQQLRLFHNRPATSTTCDDDFFASVEIFLTSRWLSDPDDLTQEERCFKTFVFEPFTVGTLISRQREYITVVDPSAVFSSELANYILDREESITVTISLQKHVENIGKSPTIGLNFSEELDHDNILDVEYSMSLRARTGAMYL